MSARKAHKLGIVWFRRDLRLNDNPALQAALTQCERIITLYVHDEPGQWPSGAASRWWLHHSLDALGADLGKRAGQLLLQQGDALSTLRSLIDATGADAVFWNRRYEKEAVDCDRDIKATLRDQGIHVESFKATLLLEPWELMTKAGSAYKVFTPFWRAATQLLSIPELIPAPSKINGYAKAIDSPPLSALGLLPKINWAEGIAEQWSCGEQAALAAAREFIDQDARHYDETRDTPGVEGVSRMSAYLHFGEISPQRLWQLTRDKHASDDHGSSAWLRQLGWREFAHYILYHYPQTSDAPMYEKYANFPWRENNQALIEAWQQGRTGIPIVDAGMRQLWHTGWMHNRVRMVVASFLVKNIRAHWLHGARWFWDCLVDADLAANSMGWQWSAGCGADAAPYFRVFNPVRQGERFDKQGDYVRRWVPELAKLPNKYLHQPWACPNKIAEEAGFVLDRDYPAPIVDLATSRDEALAALKQLKFQ